MRVGDLLLFYQRPQDGNQFKIFAWSNLQENVSGLHTLRFPDVDQHHRPVLTSLGQELALLHERVFGEVPRMAFCRVATPIDNEIGSLFHFTERARYLATQLSGDLGRTMSQRSVAIEQTA